MLSPNPSMRMAGVSWRWSRVPRFGTGRGGAPARTDRYATGSVLDDAVVATQVERVVAHALEVLRHPSHDRVEHDRGEQPAELGAEALERVVLRVEHGDVLRDLLDEALDAVGECAGLVLALEDDDARVLLEQLERAVE